MAGLVCVLPGSQARCFGEPLTRGCLCEPPLSLASECSTAQRAAQKNKELECRLENALVREESANVLNSAAATLREFEEKRATLLDRQSNALKLRAADGSEQPLGQCMGLWLDPTTSQGSALTNPTQPRCHPLPSLPRSQGPIGPLPFKPPRRRAIEPRVSSGLRRKMLSILKREANERELASVRYKAETVAGAAGAPKDAPTPLVRRTSSRFFGRSAEGIKALTIGRPEAAALGLESFLQLPKAALLSRLAEGVGGISAEVDACGDADTKECLRYILHERAGSSPRLFDNSEYPRDCDGNGLRRDRKDREGLGMRLADFVAHRSARKAELTEAHIVALRLYSSAAFRTINGPLRDQRRDTPHPLAATVAYLAEAIKKLRAVDTDSRTLDLWRGMRNLQSTEAFQNNGGTEPAPMSTTSDLNIAVGYALSEYSLLFKVCGHGYGYGSAGPMGVPWGYQGGTKGVPRGYQGGTKGVPRG